MEKNGKPKQNIYIGALKLRNIKCFKGEHIINFTDKDGKLFQWTVIIGNNNTGKTTILRAIADLEPVENIMVISKNKDRDKRNVVPFSFFRESAQKNITAVRLPEEGTFVGAKLLLDTELDRYKYNLNDKILSEPTFPQKRIFENDFPWGFDDLRLSAIDYSTPDLYHQIVDFKIYGYGVNRRAGKTAITDNKEQSNTATLFYDNATLVNTEEWLIQLDYSNKNKQPKAGKFLEKIKQILISEILPDIQDFKFTTDIDLDNYVEFKTDYGWVRLDELGYGYRSSIAWIVDLAKKMFERCPDSENPLAEAAVVLVDELDLHLHPEWQRKIISFLSRHFPNTQFIVTAHSPLIVQSAARINIVLLNKEEDHVTITQPEIPTYKGWTVEEILSELMNMGERTHSDDYLQLMDEFESALDENDFARAQAAYDKLEEIIHPDSPQRKLLRMQMSAIVHD